MSRKCLRNEGHAFGDWKDPERGPRWMERPTPKHIAAKFQEPGNKKKGVYKFPDTRKHGVMLSNSERK